MRSQAKRHGTTTQNGVPTRAVRYLLYVAAGAATLGAMWVLRPAEVAATPPTAREAATPSTTSKADSAAPQAAATRTPSEAPTRSTILFSTTPSVDAVVTWGRQRLGQIAPGKPLVVVRPRDSGPLDVVVRANGYLPVQTRAYTFTDQHLLVKLTPLDKKSELPGYRAPLDAGVEDAEEVAATEENEAPSATPFRMVPEPIQPSPLLLP